MMETGYIFFKAMLFKYVILELLESVFYPVLIAANDPLGIFTEGFFKSPLMLIPARMPVMVGKKTPKHLNHEYPGRSSSGHVLFAITPLPQPRKSFSEI